MFKDVFKDLHSRSQARWHKADQPNRKQEINPGTEADQPNRKQKQTKTKPLHPSQTKLIFTNQVLAFKDMERVTVTNPKLQLAQKQINRTGNKHKNKQTKPMHPSNWFSLTKASLLKV